MKENSQDHFGTKDHYAISITSLISTLKYLTGIKLLAYFDHKVVSLKYCCLVYTLFTDKK